MRYPEVSAAIDGITGADGPFPIIEQAINGIPRRVFGGLPGNLRDYYAFAATFGDKELFIDQERRFSFNDVMQQVAGLGLGLIERYGVQKGDRIAIAMRNCPEWCISFMAITSIGAVAVPMNSWWQGEELAYALQDSGASLVILDAPRYERVAPRLPETGLTAIAMESEGKRLPGDVNRFEELLAEVANAELPGVDTEPEDPAMILYTSGSTGRPRGVLSTQRNVLSAIGTWLVIGTALTIVDGTAGQEAESQPAILLTVPLFHVTGLNSMFLLSLGIGRKIVMMHKWDIDAALELIQAERITHFNGVPTMSMELMNHPRLNDYDLSCLVDISSGGAARPAEQVTTIVERFPGALPSAGYGLTETNAVGCIIGQQDYIDRPGSVGQPSPPLVEIRIVDDEGVPVPQGEKGEICIRSPAVVAGYLNQPAASAASFRDGWFHTGDVGYLDEEGFVYIVDRIKDIIIRGGENVSCLEVEEALYAHPEITEAAVFSLPHERLGEIVGAAVSTQAGSDLDEGRLRVFLSDRLAAFKVPQHIWFHSSSLPRIASGKIFKKQIRRELIERLGL
ncbi:MAG: acyl--CoA ligase [Gammaproteobacteria bacterium]|nr:acyl--CoA ligase [Gammaproteobacteria bacterium]